ncbi:cytochrome b [Stella sp.]|uniref:cytochrome b n=1 Tax=Stella sp. TaxID=2912054 RepID=UPI0035B0D7D1
MARGDAAAARGYSAPARGAHWITAALLAVSIPLGLVMTRIEGDLKFTLYHWHEWIGFAVWWLALFRVAWRIGHPPPPRIPPLPRLQAAAAEAVHGLLYLALLAMPVVGWIGNSAFGFPLEPFGLFRLPDLVAKDEALGRVLLDLHGWAGWAVIGLLVLHVGAALHHHLVVRDLTLRRMLPQSLGGLPPG